MKKIGFGISLGILALCLTSCEGMEMFMKQDKPKTTEDLTINPSRTITSKENSTQNNETVEHKGTITISVDGYCNKADVKKYTKEFMKDSGYDIIFYSREEKWTNCDLFLASDQDIETLYSKNAIEELSPVLDSYVGEIKENSYPYVMDLSYNGQYYGYPVANLNLPLLYYSKSRTKGYDFTSMTSLVSDLSKNNQTITFRDTYWGMYEILIGSQLYTDFKVENGQLIGYGDSYSTTYGLNTISRIKELYGSFDMQFTNKINDTNVGFIANASEYQTIESKYGDDLGVCAIPGLDSNSFYGNIFHIDSFYVNEVDDTPKQEAMHRLANFLASPYMQVFYAQDCTFVPTAKNLYYGPQTDAVHDASMNMLFISPQYCSIQHEAIYSFSKDLYYAENTSGIYEAITVYHNSLDAILNTKTSDSYKLCLIGTFSGSKYKNNNSKFGLEGVDGAFTIYFDEKETSEYLFKFVYWGTYTTYSGLWNLTDSSTEFVDQVASKQNIDGFIVLYSPGTYVITLDNETILIQKID